MKLNHKISTLLLAVLFLLCSCASRVEHANPSQPYQAQPPGASLPETLPPYSDKKATLVVTGDLMVHAEQLADAYSPDTGLYDFSHNFAQVAEDLGEGYCIGNLETVLGGGEIGYSGYPRFNTPDSFAVAAADSGFDCLSTANNHCMDKDKPGLLRTLEVLDSLGLDHTGTFATPQARDNVFIKDIDGIKVAFLSCTYGTNGIRVPAGEDYLVNVISEDQLKADILRAKRQNPDLLVVIPHLGNEYETEPLDIFKHWTDLMLHCGADMVLASHPHVLQPMEVKQITDMDGRQRRGFVIYSLGNFISSQRYTPREAGIILKLDVVKRGNGAAVLESVRFVPTWVQFRDTAGEFLVRVLPVADALRDAEKYSLSSKDVNRLTQVHSEITAMYLSAPVPLSQIQREYSFYELRPNQIDSP